MQKEITKNIENIKNKISGACASINKDPKEITLIAVSKKKSVQMIETALESGVSSFGENYAQELQEKSSINLPYLVLPSGLSEIKNS